MNKKNTLVAALCIIAAIVFGLVIASKEKASQGTIKIGIIAPLTGIVANYGEQVRKGVESVQVPANIQFVFEDDQCDAKTAVSAFKKLSDLDGVHYMIGPECGSPQEAVVPLLKGTDNLMVVPAAASKTLYEASGGNFYDIQYSLEDEAAFIADQMYTRGYKKVVVISYQNEFSKVEHDSFAAHFKGTIVHDINFAADNADVQTELAKIKGGGYDAVFSNNISFYFANGLQKMRNLGINVPVFSPYPVELPAVRQLVEGVYYSFPADINDGQGGIYGLSKQSAQLLVDAVTSCGDSYGCVKSFIDKDGFDTSGVKQRSLILKQIKNGEPVVVE